MGKIWSTNQNQEPSPPPPLPLFEREWRVIDWRAKDTLLNFARTFKPEGASHVRVLLYGPVGVGKSTFINTVGKLIVGRNVNAAAACPSNTGSFTVTFRQHQFKFGESENRPVPVVFNDLMGLEGEEKGVQTEDIKLAMKGHVVEGYEFNPSHALPEENKYFKSDPTIDDKVHVLVCMLNANATEVNSSILPKMKEIREMARDLGIPQVAVLTHIDTLCTQIEEDIQNVYRSKILKEKMDKFSAEVGIPINYVYAVWNHYEGSNRNAADTLILTALKDILDFGYDCINN